MRGKRKQVSQTASKSDTVSAKSSKTKKGEALLKTPKSKSSTTAAIPASKNMAKLKESTTKDLKKKSVSSKKESAGKQSTSGASNSSGTKKIANEEDRKECKSDCVPGTARNPSDCPNALKKITGLPDNVKSCHEVHELLKKMGVIPRMANPCLKSAIRWGHVKIEGSPDDLKQVIYKGQTDKGHEATATLRDFMFQPTNGKDYEGGSEYATIVCDGCAGGDEGGEVERLYLTGVCIGEPRFDCGKFHNHCKDCAGFGSCIGDCREIHCSACHHHWFQECSNAKCRRVGKEPYFKPFLVPLGYEPPYPLGTAKPYGWDEASKPIEDDLIMAFLDK